jgi:L-galactonate dehydratase
MKEESMERYSFPGEKGKSWWQTDEARVILDAPRVIKGL